MAKGVRDVDIDSEVMDLWENGYFDDEIAYYGCAYVEHGQIYYRVNENEEAVWRFLGQASLKRMYPTPAVSHNQRVKIPSGQKERIKELVRQAFVQHMAAAYPKGYFESLGPLAVLLPVDGAYDLLWSWRRELMACFDDKAFQLLAGAVGMSYEAKLLTDSSYQQLMGWVNDRFAQINQQSRRCGKYGRLFSGFAYQEEQQWRYFYDANTTVVYRKRWQLMQQGTLATPVFQHQYWMDILPTGYIQKLEADFAALLKSVMDEVYLQRITTIKSLASVVPETLYQTQRAMVAELGSELAEKAFNFWCLQWNCLKR